MDKRVNHHGFPMEILQQTPTPFYYYDLDVLRKTLDEINRLTADECCLVHYAVKANGNPRILKEIKSHGLGADLVSGGEIKAALEAGIPASMMTYSGVGKTDWEIRLGVENEIGCFNVESIPELEVINEIAGLMDKTANIAIRVNPDIDAHTHKYITTGTADNKFGICLEDLEQVITLAMKLPHVHLKGLHFHIGSQIVEMKPYEMLCDAANKLIDNYERQGINFETINMGGGLGIDYGHPDEHPLPELERFINTFKKRLNLRAGQQLHFELGRSIVGQCGTLICRVLYVKENRNKRFVIVDAGMTDLIRPALYEAHHLVHNLTSRQDEVETYDVVGPVCESTDVFAHDCRLPITRRGDLIAIRSAGAYGESMASTYNMRALPLSIFHSR
ncbi:MAG: diaminopimelate decarboxylase [Muribaculaceae bacterium]|nr:diaminopimelate decarboxylase [Muribaculaceae bacterium]